MVHRVQKYTGRTAAAVLILTYICIALFVPFLHNHVADASFHDNCPACQWELQAKHDDVFIASILLQTLAPLAESGELITVQAPDIKNQFRFLSDPVRGPPVPSC